jgi:hypothetical protein
MRQGDPPRRFFTCFGPLLNISKDNLIGLQLHLSFPSR